MLADFVSLVSEIFPSIDPKTASRYLRQIRLGDFDPAGLFRSMAFDFLAQGDILEPIRFVTTDDSGCEQDYSSLGLLLSNTCDADHEEHVTFAICYPFDLFLSGNIASESDVRSNCIFNLIYLPLIGPEEKGLVVDLSLLQSHSREFVSRTLVQGAARKICSLSDWGFYLLLAKLSVHLMRPETADVNRGTGEVAGKTG